MKTINKYFYLLAAAALVGIASCEKEKEAYAPGTPDSETCEGVYFIKQDVIEETQIFDPTQDKKAEIIVHRSNSVGALTVTPKVSLSEITSNGPVDGDASLFTVSDIVFEDGQDESKVTLEFPNVKEGVQYCLHLKIEGDQYASKYTSSLVACDYNVMCVKYQDFLNPVTKEPAVITFKQGAWNEVHSGNLKYYEVDGVRHCQTYNEKLVGTPGVDGGGDGGFWGQDKDVHFEFLWYVSGEEECTCDDAPHSYVIPTGKVEGVPAGAQMIRVLPKGIVDYGGSYKFYPYDYYSYYVDKNGYAKGFAHFISANDIYEYVSYYDLNGGFYFWIYGYTSAASGWVGDWAQKYDIIGIADGFVRADYTLELTAGVTEKDAEGNNVVPISFKLGSDSDLVGYTILPGKASGSAVDAEIKAISKETEAMAKDQTAWLNDDVDFSKYNSTWVLASGQSFKDSVAPKDAETGFFTVVAVAVDTTQVRNKKGKVTEIKFEVKNDANLNFQYINTGETNPVILSVAAGSTEKYISSGYSPETSFQYTISGAGLTGVIPMVYSQADVEAEGGIESILEDVLSDPNYFYSALSLKENNPSLTASQLADVNDKGFSDIYTSGVTPGTTYYVIVWATNGYDCGVAYDSILTAGDPLPIYKNFTWSDMDPSFAPESEEGLYGTYNLYACETGGSSLRQYIGKAVIADDPDTDDEGPDDNGYYDEYVSVSGLGGSALAKYEMNPSITFDYYASKFLYIATSETSDGVFDLNCFDGDVNAYQQTWADYASYFIPVAEGYWAYIGNYNYYSKSGINFNGLKFVYKNNAYASYYNYLLVDVSVDDNGVAPKAAKASVFAKTDSQEDDVVIEKMPKCPYRVEDVHLSHFFTPAGVKDLQPVVSTKEVAFNHNVDLCSTKNVVDKSNFVPSQSPVNSFNR